MAERATLSPERIVLIGDMQRADAGGLARAAEEPRAAGAQPGYRLHIVTKRPTLL